MALSFMTYIRFVRTNCIGRYSISHDPVTIVITENRDGLLYAIYLFIW